jgi:hypothetical protein
MTPIILPINSGDGPSGPLPPLAELGIGFFVILLGVMLVAMVWGMRDMLGDGVSDLIIEWCLLILSVSFTLMGVGFFVHGLWGFIF